MKRLKSFVSDFLKDYYWKKAKVLFVSYIFDKDIDAFVKLFNRVSKEVSLLQHKAEAFLIYSCTLQTNKLEGDIVEVGVYQGGTARIICEVKGSRNLFLFDTWEGLPEDGKIDSQLKKGLYKASCNGVKEYLKDFENVFFYKGEFPKTANVIKNKKFSFVSLDLDLYKPTVDALKFFYPRMVTGGIIVSHNYKDLKGIKKAFDEFFKNKSEILLPLNNSQVLIQKTERSFKLNEKKAFKNL